MTGRWDEVATTLIADRGAALARYAFLLCGDRDDAQDLVQEALVRTFSKPRLGLGVERAEAYVRRAILNEVIDRSRRDANWRRVRHLVAPEPSTPSATPGSDDRIDLMARIRELSPRQSACIVLRYYDDLPVAGVAATLGISQGAVKRYLSDALRALSAAMGDPGAGAPERVLNRVDA